MQLGIIRTLRQRHRIFMLTEELFMLSEMDPQSCVISIISSYLLSFSRRVSRYQETPKCVHKEKGQSSHDRVFNKHGYGNNAYHCHPISNTNNITINKESCDTTGQYKIHWQIF